MESKKDRFRRLATLRTNEILRRIKVLSNCSNRQVYEYTEGDIDKIFSSIDKHLKVIKTKFYFPNKAEKFKL